MGLFDSIGEGKKQEYLLQWHEKYDVGIREMDLQHRKLFGMYNALVDAMGRGESREVLEHILDELLKYVIVHFRTEENYFDKYDYPDREEHEAEHKELMEKTYYLHKDFAAGKPVLTEDVLLFLKNWISDHVLTADHKYKSFLLERIPSPQTSSNKHRCS